LSGSSPITGRTFLATGLYFFLVDRKTSDNRLRCFSLFEPKESILLLIEILAGSQAENEFGKEWMNLEKK
jgi:hypothetical protein